MTDRLFPAGAGGVPTLVGALFARRLPLAGGGASVGSGEAGARHGAGRADSCGA